MSISFPSVWNGSAYSKRLHPVSCSVYQSLQPLSTATMVLPDYDDVNSLDWVRIETPDKKVEYYRVVSVDTDTLTGQKEVYLEHGACILGDIVIPDIAIDKETDSTSKSGADLKEYPEDMTASISALVSHVLSKQPSGGHRWTVGTIASSQIIYVELGGHTLLDALTTLMQYVPDYQLEFEQRTESDWRVNVKRRPTEVVSEGRLSRNLKSCNVTYDTKDIVTSVYCEGVGYVTSRNASVYGTRTTVQNLSDNLSTSQKYAILSSFLNNHDHPLVSVSISGVELSSITGVDLDKFVVGKLCRLAVPWLNMVVDEVIIDKKYSDIYNKPEEVSFTLANATPDLVIAMAAIMSQAGGGGGGGGGGGMAGEQAEAEKKKKRYETHFEQTDEYFRLLATDTEWNEMGTEGRLTAYGQIVLSSENIEMVVAKTGLNELGEEETLYSRIGQTASEIRSEVSNVQSELTSTISQTATEIRSEVTAVDGRVSTLSQTVDGISISGNVISIKGNSIDLDGYVTVSSLQANYLSTSQLAATTVVVSGLDCRGDIDAQGVRASSGDFSSFSVGQTSYVGRTLTMRGIAASMSVLASSGANVELEHSHTITMTESGGTVTVTIGGTKSNDGTATFDIASTQYFIDAVEAAKAGVGLSGSWSGSTYTAKTLYGQEVSTTVSVTQGSWADGSIPVYAFADNGNRASGTVSMPDEATNVSAYEYQYSGTKHGAMSVSMTIGGKTYTSNCVASTKYSYDAGYTAGQADVPAVTVSVSRTDAWTSGKRCYMTCKATGSNGATASQSFNYDCSDIYNNGANGVSVSNWGTPSWTAQGVTVSITLSNGGSYTHTYYDN